VSKLKYYVDKVKSFRLVDVSDLAFIIIVLFHSLFNWAYNSLLNHKNLTFYR
jgi:hypothetical protein